MTHNVLKPLITAIRAIECGFIAYAVYEVVIYLETSELGQCGLVRGAEVIKTNLVTHYLNAK